MLFFGCRSPSQDFLYRSRLEGWRASGVLSSLAVAFSREGPCKVRGGGGQGSRGCVESGKSGGRGRREDA
jgi:hypothetical protein